MDKAAIRARVRELVESGVLPEALPTRVWVGTSEGRECLVCRERIQSGQVECEVELASTVIAYMDWLCFQTLLQARHGEPTPGPEGPSMP